MNASTRKLLVDVTKYGANMMWHLKPDTEAGKLYDRIEKELAAPPAVTDYLDEREFYELMQQYRHSAERDQPGVIRAYEAVKAFVRKQTR